jgi:hypothetical protein
MQPHLCRTHLELMVVRWSLLQAHLRLVWAGGTASFIAESSSLGAGGSLILESGDWWTTGRSIAMNGGSGANSLGGSVTIESGVGTEVTGIRVRLVFRPPMQVFLESVVACH